MTRCARASCCVAVSVALLTGCGWAAAVTGVTNSLTADAAAAPETVRDPFWPVGYAPPVETAADPAAIHRQLENQVRANETEWRAAQKLLVVRGVMSLNRHVADGQVVYGALINGQCVEAGGVASAVMNGKTFHWRVTRVTAEGPVLERLTNDGRKGSDH